MQDNNEKRITTGEWDEMIAQMRDISGKLQRILIVIVGDEEMNERGMKKEHDEMNSQYELWEKQNMFKRIETTVKRIERIHWLLSILGFVDLGLIVTIILKYLGIL